MLSAERTPLARDDSDRFPSQRKGRLSTTRLVGQERDMNVFKEA